MSKGSKNGVALHPLVVMNIADQFTLSTIQSGAEQETLGVVLGTAVDGIAHITDCIELSYEKQNSTAKLFFEEFEEDFKLHKQAYPYNKVLGWYCTGEKIESLHKNIHQSVMTWYGTRKSESGTEGLLFLMMNPQAKVTDEKLPIAMYNEKLEETEYQIKADPAETVAVVHCSQEATDAKKGSKLVNHFKEVHRGLTMMRERLNVIHDYVVECKKKKIPRDMETLRKIKGICNRLPTMQTEQLHKEFQSEHNDALLITYLASITKESGRLSSIMQNFNTIHGNTGRGGFMNRYDD